MSETVANNNNMASSKGNTIPRKAVAPKIQNNSQSPSTSERQQQQQNPPRPLSVDDQNHSEADAMTSKSTAERDPTPTTTPTPPPTSDPVRSSAASSSGGAALGEPSLSAKEKKPSVGSLSTAAATTTTDAASNNNDSCGLPPPDFQGEVETNNELPTPETLRKIESYTVLDADGKSHTFKSLYAGHNVARRVMIIFVRHFFCGVSFASLYPLYLGLFLFYFYHLPIYIYTSMHIFKPRTVTCTPH